MVASGASSSPGIGIHIREQELVDKLWLYRGSFLPSPSKQHATQHAVTVEPVSIPAEIVVCDGVAAIANVLPATQIEGDRARVRTWRQ